MRDSKATVCAMRGLHRAKLSKTTYKMQERGPGRSLTTPPLSMAAASSTSHKLLLQSLQDLQDTSS